MSEFAVKLKRELKKRHMTQLTLSVRAGLDTTCVSRWFTKDVKPRKQSIKQICEALNVPEDYFEDVRNSKSN